MGNLYRLNSLFELEISQFGNSLEIEKALLDRSTALEYLFLLLSLACCGYLIYNLFQEKTVIENDEESLVNFSSKRNNIS